MKVVYKAQDLTTSGYEDIEVYIDDDGDVNLDQNTTGMLMSADQALEVATAIRNLLGRDGEEKGVVG